MEQYLGTEIQMRLQRKADELAEWMYSTPGACHPGRFVGTDNPDELGWDVILEHLRRDGALGFRLIPTQEVDRVRARLDREGFRIDTWDVFAGDAKTVAAASEPIARQPLPDGLHLLENKAFDDADTVRQIQSFLVDNGIAPFSGAMLSGQLARSCLVAIRHGAGKIVATAYGYFPHNRHSPRLTHAWGGLVAVDPSQRGKRLGVWINARMVWRLTEELGASHVHELVSATNETSRRMVERCGLHLDESVKCGIAMAAGERFTR